MSDFRPWPTNPNLWQTGVLGRAAAELELCTAASLAGPHASTARMNATPLTWYALSPRFWAEVWALVVLLYPSACCAEVYETAVNMVLQLAQ